MDIYVSKLGDNSTGADWRTAFHTIQQGLLAVPDFKGGHRVVVRPDTYFEANLYPSYRGAEGAYNELIGDFDGRLGSGGTGRIVIDSSALERGFNSREGGTMRACGEAGAPPHKEPNSSGIGWDRWIVRRVYATGGETGLFWDLAGKAEAFTVVVEDSVGIARAFGGGVANHFARPDEPVVFRRCNFYCLDWRAEAGDTYITGAACVRSANSSLQEYPDATFEDCTLVSPDNALQSGHPHMDESYTRVRLKNCRLIVLNFSQAVYSELAVSTGIVRCDAKEGKQLHVDFEDCRLMGYKVFGMRTGEISYAITGRVQAYLQFAQATPTGFERIGLWPKQLIAEIGLPDAKQTGARFPATLAGATPSGLPFDPSAPNYTGRKGSVCYVSKLGDNSNGNSWKTAFHTIQAALSAVPDDKGGHCIVVRPDTYLEIGLVPTHKGAVGAYNKLVGDVDGKLGSGAKGWVVIDCGDPHRGFKSTDYNCLFGQWANLQDQSLGDGYRSLLTDKNLPGQERKWVKETLAEIQQNPKTDLPTDTWDRWMVAHIYATAANCMLWIDQERENQNGPCSMVIDDCVAFGQATSGGGAWFVGRPDEPLLFRRCYFMNLDWFGDCGAAYVRAEHASMPDYPDAVFEDCTLVSPDNALQTFSPGCDKTYTRVRLKSCQLIVLNFPSSHRQPAASNVPTNEPSGIVCCAALEGRQLHIDFEDCRLMGWKVFGTRSGEVSYTTKGKVQAYVEYEQPVPRGFERLGFWPVQLFDNLAPPQERMEEI